MLGIFNIWDLTFVLLKHKNLFTIFFGFYGSDKWKSLLVVGVRSEERLRKIWRSKRNYYVRELS